MESKKTILLIEDEPEFRMALRMRLEASGYEVLEAGDGALGLEMARNKKPHLIMLDIMLPKLDGFKVARLLKFDAQYKHLPIIMLSARAQQSDKDTGLSVGGDVYLTKPFDPPEMLAAVARLLAKSEAK